MIDHAVGGDPQQQLVSILNSLIAQWDAEIAAVTSTERGPIDYREATRKCREQLWITMRAWAEALGAAAIPVPPPPDASPARNEWRLDDRGLWRVPSERHAIEKLFEAYQELKRLGWNDAIYCPKDGTWFDAIEVGSTGIHHCQYQGEWPTGSWWIADGDLWPARPCLFRLKKVAAPHAAAASEE